MLLDNGRTNVLADQVGRQTLACIRCSACLNVCPVYARTGGHAYGSVYPGPIGAILTPQLARHGRGAARCPTPRRSAVPATRSARSRSTSRASSCTCAARVVRESVGRRQSERAAMRALAWTFGSDRALPPCADGSARLGSRPFARRGGDRPAARPRRRGRERATCPRCRRRRSANGGRADDAAREEILARIAAALRRRAGGRAARRGRTCRASTARSQGGDVVERFVERLRDTATVVPVSADDGGVPSRSPMQCRRGASRDIAVPADLPEAWRPRGVEVVVDEVPRRRGARRRSARAVTGCRACDRRDRDDRARRGRGPGPARCSALVPDFHMCVVAARAGRRTASPRPCAGIAASVATTRRPVTFISGPVGDVGHRALARRGRPRAAAVRRRAGARLTLSLSKLSKAQPKRVDTDRTTA